MKRKSVQNESVEKADVAVVGGGPAGLSLAALLGARGVRTLVLDRAAPAAALDERFDERTTAISWGSQKVLAAAGAWDELASHSCPIETIRIYDGGGPVLLDFDSAEVSGAPFGWIVENRFLRQALYERLRALDTVTLIAPATVTGYTADDSGVCMNLEDGRVVRAALAVGADGRDSFLRTAAGIGSRGWSYGQQAVVCPVTHENPHANAAVEDFRPEGPFAVLPMTDGPDGRFRSALVWTEHGRRVQGKDSALKLPPDLFNAALAARFPAAYGAVRLDGPRFAYPLGLVHAYRYVAPRVALIADAAHGIHPIAGQGLNLGFRDIAVLGTLVADAVAAGADPGAAALLDRYQRARRFDNMAMAGATDVLNRLFSNDLSPLRLARRTGLRAVARLPLAKRFFMRQAMGAAGILPPLMTEREAV